MRKLIASFRMSIDGKIEGPEGYTDWVAAWSEEYGLTAQIDACLVGGGRVAAALLDAGLVDELRLIVYPLIAGPGRALFASVANRRKLELQNSHPLQDGRIGLVYGIG